MYRQDLLSIGGQKSLIFIYGLFFIYSDTIGGVLGNHLNCRSTAILGSIFYTAGTISCSFTTNIYQMYCTSALAGKIQA